MTFPRHKSRPLVVGDQSYRWAVSPVGADFVQRLYVDPAEGPGQRLICAFEAAHGDAAITPAQVRGVIERALAAGWDPTRKGKAFVLDPCPPRPELPVWATSAPTEEPGTLSLESWTALDPVRRGFPWEHHANTFSRFRVWGGVTDIQVGSVFAEVATDRHARPGSSREEVFGSMLPQEDEENGDELTFYIRGGRVLRRGDTVLMDHGCCTTLDEWVGWLEFLNGGHSPWNGHDPMSSAERVEDRIRFVDSHEVVIDLPEYARLVRGLQRDVRDFHARAAEWLDRHAPRDLQAPVLAVLARTLHLADAGAG
ncbi:MAG: hypothetical protein QM820_29775 [Minicystis sp.]